MKLQEIFDALWYGELSQVFQGGTDATEGIREEDRKKVISHIQLGLTSLHRRFNYRLKMICLRLKGFTIRTNVNWCLMVQCLKVSEH